MISLIAAMAANRVIGRDGSMPWDLPDDLQRFKQLTMGHTVIMGRRTHEAIGRPLPGRTNIVLSRQPDYSAPGCTVAHSLADALRCRGTGEDEVFIIGGAGVYRQALPIADWIYLTTLHKEVCGDTTFPEFSLTEFREVESEFVDGTDPHTFSVYQRVRIADHVEPLELTAPGGITDEESQKGQSGGVSSTRKFRSARVGYRTGHEPFRLG